MIQPEPVVEPQEVFQKPLLMRIKEARAAQWTQSNETLNEDSPTGSQSSAPPPYSEVLNIIQLSETEDTKKRSESISSAKNSAGTTVVKKTEDSLTVPSRKRSRTVSSRDEMLYSNLSLVVLPQGRSASNLNQSGAEDEVSKSCCSGFDLSLLKRPSFVLLAMSGFLCLVGFFIPFIYLSDRAKQLGKHFPIAASLKGFVFLFLAGISPDKCAFILSIIGITNTIGRVFCGWASDNRVNALLLNNIALTIGGIATIISPIIFNSYATLVFYGSIFGFAIGVQNRSTFHHLRILM